MLPYRQGCSRDYHTNPYGDFEKTAELYFALAHNAPRRYHTKENALGVQFGNQARAYPFVELDRHGKATFSDELAGQHFIVNWDADNGSATITDMKGKALSSTTAFWFA